MLTRAKYLSALVTGMLLALPTAAQFGPIQNQRGGVPVFQTNQNFVPNAFNQALANQPFTGPVGGAIPGLPNYLGGGRLINQSFSGSGFNGGFNGGIGYDPYSPGLPGYSYPYYPYYDAGSYYRGIGDLTRAYGQYIQDYQRGRLLNQDVERAKIETRRRLYDEWRYYQSQQPMAEDIRRTNLDRDLSRARRQAPTGEVLSGKSLNDLLAFLKGEASKGRRGPALPLDEEMMKRVNVASPRGGNIGLVKSGKINWPLVLRDEAFNDVREKIDTTLANAINRARTNGNVDAALMKELTTSRDKMDAQLDKIASNLNMAQYMEAKRYLNWLGDGLRALADPNVAGYFDRTYEARGKTVGDLVEYMTRQGLSFAPSVPGDEPAYQMLYNALVAYDQAVQLVSR